MDNLQSMIIESLKEPIINLCQEFLDNPNTKDFFVKASEEEINEALSKKIDSEEFTNQFLEKMYDKIKHSCDNYISTYTASIKEVKVINKGKVKRTDTKICHEKFEYIANLIYNNFVVFLSGPAGSGKTETVRQIAQHLGYGLYVCNPVRDEYKFEGFMNANGEYVETPFYNAFVNGGIFVLEEVDNCDPQTLKQLNLAIGNGFYPFPHGIYNAHENFRCVFTANTLGDGKSIEYVGGNRLDKATLDRFMYVIYDYDKELERALYPDEEILEVFWELRKAALNKDIKCIFSTRGIKLAYEARKLDLFSDEQIIESVIVRGNSVDDLKILVNTKNISYENKFFEALLNVIEKMKKASY